MPARASPPLLVAEDDPNDMFLFTRLLTAAGPLHPLHIALNQAEAIRLLKPVIEKSRLVAKPAAIFISASLPRGGALELLRWIREQRALDDVAVLLMAREPKRAEIERVLKLGAQCFFKKFPPKLAVTRLFDGAASFSRNRSPAAFDLPENLCLHHAT